MERDFYFGKLELISQTVNLLGAEGSLLVKNIKYILEARPDQQIGVNPDGTLNIK